MQCFGRVFDLSEVFPLSSSPSGFFSFRFFIVLSQETEMLPPLQTPSGLSRSVLPSSMPTVSPVRNVILTNVSFPLSLYHAYDPSRGELQKEARFLFPFPSCHETFFFDNTSRASFCSGMGFFSLSSQPFRHRPLSLPDTRAF